jgi:glutathione S-transferase
METYDIAALLRPKCKVCSSPLRQGVDLRLMRKEVHEDSGEPYDYAEIIDWAGAHGLIISKAGLSRHKTDHLMPDVLAAIEAQRQVEAIAQATGQTLGMETAFLNTLVNKALKKLGDSELSDDGKWLGTTVRAIEALLKVKKAEVHFSKEKLAEADKAISAKARETGMSPETLLAIRRDLYGLTDATPPPDAA